MNSMNDLDIEKIMMQFCRLASYMKSENKSFPYLQLATYKYLLLDV